MQPVEMTSGDWGRRILIILCITVLPLVLGLLVIGRQPPSGRTTRSTSRVGHKAGFLVLQRLGYDVRRFARGVESLPKSGGIFVALEPGPSLLRERGAFAGGLLAWVEAGNGALLTLGRDPDRLAEFDDREMILSETASRAVAFIEEKRAEAAENVPEERRQTTTTSAAPEVKTSWADERGESWSSINLAEFLSLSLDDGRLGSATKARPLAFSGPLADRFPENAFVLLTRPRIWTGSGVEAAGVKTLLKLDGRPVLLEVARGQGRFLLLSEPRILQNMALASGSHAEVLVRSIESLVGEAPPPPIYFEEFSHGERDASNIFSVAFGTRAKWFTFQLLALGLFAALAFGAARRAPVPYETAARRSRNENIDAMAALFFRSGDLEGTARKMAEHTSFRVALAIGGGDGALDDKVAERLKMKPEEIHRLLEGEGVAADPEAVTDRARKLAQLRRSLSRSPDEFRDKPDG